jgi:secondary thiamine-phosphate synthase enzyme
MNLIVSDAAVTAVDVRQDDAAESAMDPRSTGGMKTFARTWKVVTDSRVELYNVTDRVRELVKASGVKAGFVIISTLHTTTAVFMNEFQAALMADLKSFLNRLANREHGYLHNCEDCSDCDRRNADAHLKAMLLGQNLTVAVQEGAPLLGQWQSILFAELDGPRERVLNAQVIGV